jgi:hypothetical protein
LIVISPPLALVPITCAEIVLFSSRVSVSPILKVKSPAFPSPSVKAKIPAPLAIERLDVVISTLSTYAKLIVYFVPKLMRISSTASTKVE